MHKTNKQAEAGDFARLSARYLITAILQLDSAAHIGGITDSSIVDMELLRIPTHHNGDQTDGDQTKEMIILPGSSLAGALRNYVCDYLLGYGVPEKKGLSGKQSDGLAPYIRTLFGGSRGETDPAQSLVSVFDSPLIEDNPQVEIRDGVALDPETGRAADSYKYDLEVLPQGSRFRIHLELIVPQNVSENELLSLLALALSGLEKGEIPIGARRTRGFGACRAFSWRVHRFDLTTKAGWLEWLQTTPAPGGPELQKNLSNSIIEAIAQAYPGFIYPKEWTDARDAMRVELHLRFPSGLLVRSPGQTADAADATHLSSGGRPVLPGTSLAGALRSRALRIARLVRSEKGDAEQWVEKMFGPRNLTEDNGDTVPRSRPDQRRALRASLLRVTESPISGDALQQLRVGRVCIDRFTGGALGGALYDEEPVYGGETTVTLELRCAPENQDKKEAMRGLLLLTVKDLITGDLSVGGTGGVGRGTAIGRARISWKEGNKSKECMIGAGYQTDDQLINELNQMVKAFRDAAPLPEEGTE